MHALFFSYGCANPSLRLRGIRDPRAFLREDELR